MLSLQPALSEQDVKRIHAHSLDVLHNVGIDYKTPKALGNLGRKGLQSGLQAQLGFDPPRTGGVGHRASTSECSAWCPRPGP